jgi:CRP-like cAMP-binding protein
MALLHGTLLPINLYRFAEMLKLTRRVKSASKSSDMSGVWLKPYMKQTRCKAGTELFKKGDPAEHLYFLAEGKIEFVEISQTMGPGRMFGEIAFFAPNNQRTASARCVEDSLVLSMNQRTMKELYYQNPSFGFELGAPAGRAPDRRRRAPAGTACAQPGTGLRSSGATVRQPCPTRSG